MGLRDYLDHPMYLCQGSYGPFRGTDGLLEGSWVVGCRGLYDHIWILQNLACQVEETRLLEHVWATRVLGGPCDLVATYSWAYNHTYNWGNLHLAS